MAHTNQRMGLVQSPCDEAGQTTGAGASACGLTRFWLPQPPEHLFTHQLRSPSLVRVQPLLRHFADINTFMVQQVVKFTKDLPIFRCVPSPCLSEENAPVNPNPTATKQGHPVNQPISLPVPEAGLESRSPSGGSCRLSEVQA